MAARAIWKGQIRLSLVSIPVEIYSATKSGARVSFRQIHEPSGKRVRYEKTVPGIGPVDADEIVKGYETDDGYVLIDPDEIDDIKLETKKTLELVQFVGQAEIPPLYYDKPYYVVALDDLAEEAYRVVRDALRREGKVGLGQLTMRGKEYLAAIRPCGDGLLLETLRYADEIRDAAPMFAEISEEESEGELLDVATDLIERKTKPFDATAFHDAYADALRDLLEAKRKDRSTRTVEQDEGPTEGENVVDLMGALKKSLDRTGGGDKGGKAKSKGGGKSAKGKSTGGKSGGKKAS
ncbi:DNA end-binding protein Ku [Tranquillimonas rosea]|uniref:Non-homologous end joining protein Ku n=1 Tax=Tranquillimonas rosea TaxID=641238 RepID=A0A1H9TRY9_9RHOB|nr:Ku protein [Tranquillimonas rosea]SER99985.1 DNA end-binding protein Ku [Tranquillimonas rosea]